VTHRDVLAWDPDPLLEGDRVRVRLSGECRAPTILHCPDLHGARGDIEAVLPEIDHRYLVRCERGFPAMLADGTRRPVFVWFLARTELERLV
jgi:hypothetical protein